MKRALCILLICIMTLPLLSACGDTGSGSDVAVSTERSEETTAEESVVTEPAYVLTPEDFGGIEFTYFGVDPHSRQDWTVNTYSEIIAESENGEPINDAIYKRNVTVEELYNIKIREFSTARESVGPDALKVILSGDDIYQIVNLCGTSAAPLLNRQDALYDLSAIETMDLSHSWWDANSVEAFSIGGHTFCAVGDGNLRSFFSSVVLMMNKQIVADYGVDSPFKLVSDGNWTMDAMLDMAKTVTRDVDGDGAVGVEDSAGFFGEGITVLWGLNAMGIQTVTNKGGTPVLTLDSERTVSAIEKYVALLRSGDYGIFANTVSSRFAGENIWRTRMLPMLMENHLLFYNHYLGSSLDLRSMDSDFGIIPLPKSDETQDAYHTATHPCYISFTTIPVTNAEPERTGLIAETMTYLSSEYIVPAVYETTLIGKVIRDEESEAMLDIIFANRVYDIGYIFNWGELSGFISSFASDNKTDFASSYARSESKIQNAIDTYMAAYAG